MKTALLKFTPTPRNPTTFKPGGEWCKKGKSILPAAHSGVWGFILGMYRVLISPILHASPLFAGSGCRFHPTCATYAAEALGRYGFFLGSLKACCRILRCHPFNRGGYEPLL